MSVTSRVPFNVPVAVGEKAILVTQLAPAASEAPQPFDVITKCESLVVTFVMLMLVL